MERYNVRGSLNGDLSPIPPSFQPIPSSQISLPPKPPISSYLNRQTNSNDNNDTELSIFDARRYFNEVDQQTIAKRTILLNGINGNQSYWSTPTVSSEASWNSQSGLLSNPPASVALHVRAFPLNEKRLQASASPSFSAGRRRFFGRNCPCYSKKSVDVEDKLSEPTSPDRRTREVESLAKVKISAGGWAKDSSIQPFPSVMGHRIVNSGRPFMESAGFSFPALIPQPYVTDQDPAARDPIQVLRPTVEDDVKSDASSDLFEIESISTTTSAVYRRRDSLDELPKIMMAASIAQSECYAPSEVSVEWSVTTAEGGFDRASLANFSSAASDYDAVQFIQTEHNRLGNNYKKKRSGGGLLSCRCENAVNVGPDPVRIGHGQGRAGEPDRVNYGRSRFVLEKGELVRSNSARMHQPVQTR